MQSAGEQTQAMAFRRKGAQAPFDRLVKVALG